MAPMPRSRYAHSCGLVHHPEFGPEIVAAGGYDGSSGVYLDSVDIYTVNTDLWREGNMRTKYDRSRKLNYILITANLLPKTIGEAAVVPYDDSFLIVGGYNANDGYIQDIYQYDAANDEWIELEAKLKTPRSHHVALLVKPSLFPECP